MNDKIQIVVNGVEFIEINSQTFAIVGEENKYPFIRSGIFQHGNEYRPTMRSYEALQFNGKYYAPKTQQP